MGRVEEWARIETMSLSTRKVDSNVDKVVEREKSPRDVQLRDNHALDGVEEGEIRQLVACAFTAQIMGDDGRLDRGETMMLEALLCSLSQNLDRTWSVRPACRAPTERLPSRSLYCLKSRWARAIIQSHASLFSVQQKSDMRVERDSVSHVQDSPLTS